MYYVKFSQKNIDKLCSLFLADKNEWSYKLNLTSKEERMTAKYSSKEMKTIGVNMALTAAMEIERRAKTMNVSTSQYCKTILQQWLDSGRHLSLSE